MFRRTDAMHRIDNLQMLNLFVKADEIRYFYDCHDIIMAGKNGYKIKEITYFAEDALDPLSSYACFKTYYDDSVTVTCNSKNEPFVSALANFLLAHPAREIDIGTPFPEIYHFPCVKEKFVFPSTEHGSPIYALYSKDTLPPLQIPAEITVALITDRDRAKIQADLTLLSELEDDLRSPEIFDHYVCFHDTRFYLMKHNEKIIGFLRAECGYKNFYDIGWLYVAPKFRNNGYGKVLTLFFSYDCLANGKFPHYGYAVSDESISVARRCGYVNTHTSREWKKLEKRKVKR